MIEIISVPELHLLLGIVEKFIKEFQNKVFPSKEMGKAFLDKFLKKVNIVRKEYQGGQSLEVNQSRKFLKCLDQLELDIMMAGGEVVIKGLPFLKAFRSFNRVVSLCFGMTLGVGYMAAIKEFKKDYLELGITVTPKAHIVFQHITEFLQIVNTQNYNEPVGLGYYSEQSFEALHSDMKV